MRGLHQIEPVALPGTDGARDPFFSPDGDWLGFLGAGNKLQKIALAGGPPITLASVDSGFFGAAWGTGDIIVIATGYGLRQLPAGGGRLALLTAVDTSLGISLGAHRFPEFLPDGRTVLFQIRDNRNVDRLAAVSLKGGAIQRFDEVGADPRYVTSGHVLLSSQTGAVVAVPFDAARVAVTGQAIPVAEGVLVGSGGAARMGVSRSGTLVYAAGAVGSRSLVLVDRKGAVQQLSPETRGYASPRFSPDGRSIAVSVVAGTTSSIWVFDLAQKTLTRLTFSGDAMRPFWTPDGSRVTYTGRDEPPGVWWVRADGSAQPAATPAGQREKLGDDWSPDGRTLVYHAGGAARNDIMLLSLDSGSTPRPYLNSEADEFAPAVSPDGAWLAYTPSASGRNEVYVRSFPVPGGKVQVSLSGGGEPRWSRDGRELFYRNGDQMLAATVQSRPAFGVQRRTELFRGNFPYDPYFAEYDVTPDGRHFLMAQGEQASQGFIVVLNWFDQLRGKRGRAQQNAAGQ